MTQSQYLDHLIDSALKEDLGHGDLTSQLILKGDEMASGIACAKGDFVLAGLDVFMAVFRHLDQRLLIEAKKADGDLVKRGEVLCEISGAAGALLAGERVALNFLQHLSGIATLTRRFVDIVSSTSVQIMDTRKTIPTLRPLQKYAVRVGGGRNHRFGLFDGVLLKDNHIRIAGGIGEAVRRARRSTPQPMQIEVEVTTLAELREALAEAAEIVLLDNMPVELVRECVAVTGGRAVLEVSGGINLDNVLAYARTGVNRISIGGLTHSASGSDISFEMLPVDRNWL